MYDVKNAPHELRSHLLNRTVNVRVIALREGNACFNANGVCTNTARFIRCERLRERAARTGHRWAR